MKTRAFLLVTALGALVVGAQAQVLLNIDITNPGAVTVTATGAAAAASSSGTNFRIRLMDFFTAGSGLSFPQSFTLIGNLASTLTYTRGSVPNNDRHFRIFRNPAGSTQTFVAGQTAFTGASAVNLSTSASLLPTSTLTGDIEVLDNFGEPTGVIIGQYAVTAVPEPATLAALGLGAAALLRRRKK